MKQTHTCKTCGHEVKVDGQLDGPVEHLPDGRHKWSLRVGVGLSLRGFGGGSS